MSVLDLLNADPPPPPPPPLTEAEEAALERAARALVTTLKNPHPTADEVETTLQLYREAGAACRRRAIEAYLQEPHPAPGP